MNVRKAQREDLPRIYSLESDVGKYPYSQVVLRQFYDVGAIMVVADAGDKFGTYSLGAFNPQDNTAQILAVMTRPEYRRSGLAKQVLRLLIDLLAHNNPENYRAVISPENIESRGLFKSLGFVETGEESNYYSGGEARIVVTKVRV